MLLLSKQDQAILENIDVFYSKRTKSYRFRYKTDHLRDYSVLEILKLLGYTDKKVYHSDHNPLNFQRENLVLYNPKTNIYTDLGLTILPSGITFNLPLEQIPLAQRCTWFMKKQTPYNSNDESLFDYLRKQDEQ